MQKKETAKMKTFIPKILEDNFERFGLKVKMKINENLISFDDNRSVTLNEEFKQSLIPLSLSVSNPSVSQSGLIHSIRAARSESLTSAYNCPHNAAMTSLTPAPPCAWDRESCQHERHRSHSDFLSTTILLVSGEIGVLFFNMILTDIDELYVVIGMVTNLACMAVISALIGDSNSPMPPPVGGILDTPIATFLSRIPVALSLWINHHLCTLACSLTIRAGCAGGLLHQNQPPPRPDSNPLNHDKLSREVIDIVFVNQLITSLTPRMLISFSDLFIYLLIQVYWICTKYHLSQVYKDSSEKTA